MHAEAFPLYWSWNEVGGFIFCLIIFGAVTYFTNEWVVDAVHQTRRQKVETQKQELLNIHIEEYRNPNIDIKYYIIIINHNHH